MLYRRNFLTLSLVLSSGPALAQGNSKIVRIVVPFAAGGVQDLLARALSTEFGLALGQTVIIDNKPGAGGTVGTGFVARGCARQRRHGAGGRQPQYRWLALYETEL